MKLNKAAITILLSKEGMKIELHDQDASITFAEIFLDTVQTCQALSRLGYTGCEIELRGLDRVGKKMEHKKIEFEIPEGYYKRSHKKDLETLAEKACPEGWISSNYFNSQDSFFIKDGKRYARTTIRRWV
jgi:hypothetical protein